jgi:hypothetical protein
MGEDQLFILQFLIENPHFKPRQEIVYTYNSGNDNSLTSSKASLRDLKKIIELENNMVISNPAVNQLRNYFVFKQLLSLFQHGDWGMRLFSLKTTLRLLGRGVFSDQLHMLKFTVAYRRSRQDA